MDELIATALKLDELAKCPGCGQYTDEAHDPENDGGYDVEEVICYGCAAQERWRRDKEKSRPEPGTLTLLKKLVSKRRQRRSRASNDR